MTDKKKVFALMGEVTGSIFPLGREVVMPLFEKHFTEQRFYQPTFMAFNTAPKPISVEVLSKRTPYGNADVYAKTLADTAEAGYLDADGAGGYIVSEKGTQAIAESHTAFYAHITEISQFPAEKMAKLAALLQKLVDSCTQVEFKSGTIALDISHGGHPKVESGSLAEVDQHLDDLNAFRDDAHIAAWTPSGVNGQLWESLSFVWNGEANNAEKLAERLPFRNYTAEDYAKALDELKALGWIDVGDDGYVITDIGKKMREDAEAATNRNYFLPWASLSNVDLKILEDLLTELKESNEHLLPKAE
ncbi:MAG: hypothetical protein GY755_20090 [Chloroflexi bacterium]|nr:hypothetical protein [Chloroflexota bacterium]